MYSHDSKNYNLLEMNAEWMKNGSFETQKISFVHVAIRKT